MAPRSPRPPVRRAIKPPSTPEPAAAAVVEPAAITESNGNPLDATTAPHTVGPEVYWPTPPPPAPWAGWPVEWATPSWWGSVMSQVYAMTDTVFAALDLNSSVMASMPAYRTDAMGDPLPDLEWQRNPDPDIYASWYEYAKQLFWHYQAGEAFVLCTARYATGWPARFHCVEPWSVEVDWHRGLRRYVIDNRAVPEGDLLHIRYASNPAPGDPRGHGALEAGRQRLLTAAVLQRYASTLAAQGGVPTFAITHPDELTARQITDLQQQWYASRVAALGLPAVLSGGITLETLQIDPQSMMLVELLQLTEQRLAVLLGVPPVLLSLPAGQGSLVYQNVASIYDFHWRAYLKPRAEAVMQALSLWALPRGQAVELNRDEYVRGDLGQRAAAYATLHGIADPDGTVGITAAEVRVAERFGAMAPAASVVPVLGGPE